MHAGVHASVHASVQVCMHASVCELPQAPKLQPGMHACMHVALKYCHLSTALSKGLPAAALSRVCRPSGEHLLPPKLVLLPQLLLLLLLVL